MALDVKKLAEYAKNKPGKKGLPEMIKGKYGKKGKGDVHIHQGHEEPDGDEGDEHHHVDADAIGDRVQAGKGDKRLMKMSKGITEETNPPDAIEDEDIWEKAKDAVEPRWEDYDEPYAVVMHVYEAMGGKFKGEGGKGKGRGKPPFGKDRDRTPGQDEPEDDEE